MLISIINLKKSEDSSKNILGQSKTELSQNLLNVAEIIARH
jgi:hypothetical protein